MHKTLEFNEHSEKQKQKKFRISQTFKKNYRKFKKSVDNEEGMWYSIQAPEREGERENLENDTERQKETTVNSEMSFSL